MMTQRNVELQLQALELIERKYGITPQSFIPKTKEKHVRDIPITIENTSNLENDVMEEVAKNFSTEEPSTSSLGVQNILEEKQILEKALQETKEKGVPIASTVKPEEVIREVKAETPKVELPTKSTEVNATELKKRQEYLRAQRDKLVALKKEARKKQLNTESGTKEKSKERPRSAKAAEAVLTGEKPTIEPRQLQIRKTLAERLKSEVVANKENK